MSDKILVSVCCVAYNHESFIRNCLDGFVSQITDFNYEILIHDDASSDNTQSIIKIYEEKYPDKIYGIYQSENQWIKNGRNPLLKILFPIVQGKYIALCEGDDYWTDPYKLQKQVDFLEANKDYAICFHPAYEMHENAAKVLSNKNLPGIPTSFTIEDLALGNFLHTPTVLFRNCVINELPSWFFDCPAADYPLYMLLAMHGKIMYMPQPMAVYRIHSSSIWSSLREVKRWELWMTVLKHLISFFDGPVRENLKQHEFRIMVHISELYQNDNETQKSLDVLSSALLLDKKKTTDWLITKYLPLQKISREYPNGVRASFNHFKKIFLTRIRKSKKK